MDNFSPSARSAKNGPGPGTPPYWGLRVLTACAGLITLPCFRLSLSSGFCFRASVSGPQFRHAPSLLYLRPHRRRQGPARHHQEGCVPSHRPLRLQMDPLATGDKELRGTGSWRFPASFCKAARHHLSLRSRCLFCDPTRWPSPWVALACLLALPPPPPSETTMPCFTPFSVAAAASSFWAFLGFCGALAGFSSTHLYRHSSL